MKLNSPLMLIAIGLVTLVLSGCNTVKGVGQDMQQGGQNLQQAAVDNSHPH